MGRAQETTATPAGLVIPDGTPIKLRIAESVSSTHARVGDMLDFVVVRDVNLGGFTVIPAGTVARGSVTGVKGRRPLGMGGQVSLKLDSLDLANGDRVRLRASKQIKGHSRTTLMIGGMIATGLIFLPATPVFLLTRGHESTVVKSTEITAQVDGATAVPSAGLRRSRGDSAELSELMDYLPPRIFNAEGREGDMLNLVFIAQQSDLQEDFERAGWVKTDKWKPPFVWHLLRRRTHDTQLPMARFYLFGRVQDYSYALSDADPAVSRRHHLRIWKTGYTSNGTPIWVGAATHDVAIDFAKGGHLINHRIDPAVDVERDFIGANLAHDSLVNCREYLQAATPVFQAQTISGESYYSDSRILLLELQPSTPVETGMLGQASAGLRAVSAPMAVPVTSYRSGLLSPR